GGAAEGADLPVGPGLVADPLDTIVAVGPSVGEERVGALGEVPTAHVLEDHRIPVTERAGHILRVRLNHRLGQVRVVHQDGGQVPPGLILGEQDYGGEAHAVA